MALPEELLRLISEARGISSNSKEVKEGFLFFAIKGANFDGHNFVHEAVRKGAIGVVVERDVGKLPVRCVKVRNTRKALGESAHLFFGEPSRRLKVIGVTGTNGKTSTTYILESILSARGEKVGLIGTVHYRLGGKILGEGRTTPDPVTWHRTLAEMKKAGAGYVTAEVSSHALDQFRVWGTEFDAVVFTNLTRDHLDYHGSMEEYFLAKRRLFTDYKFNVALINTDDPYGRRLIKELKDKALSFGKDGEIRILNFTTGFEGSVLDVEFGGKKYSFRTNLVGDFQAYNLCASIAYSFYAGIEPEVIRSALKHIFIPGRFEVYRAEGGFSVVIDYAHTPDAVDNVLRTVRKLSEGRVITVLGAGGNRDREKRPIMGSSAERWSNLLILTSDNPRDEDPLSIIKDILKGVKKKESVLVVPDRKEAIGEAIRRARPGDVIAVLGKGHENYQEIKGVKYPFSDAQVVKEFLRGGKDAL